MPPLLHGQAEAHRLRRPRRALHPEVRDEDLARRRTPRRRRPEPRAWGRDRDMDSITFQKLRDIEARFGAIQAQMSDPAVAQDPSAFQKLATRVEGHRPGGRALPRLQGDPERAGQGPGDGQGRDRPRASGDGPRGIARPRGPAGRARRRDPPPPHPQGPERREERAPRDPRGHRRRRGRALRGRGLPHVLALRRAAGLEDRRRSPRTAPARAGSRRSSP